MLVLTCLDSSQSLCRAGTGQGAGDQPLERHQKWSIESPRSHNLLPAAPNILWSYARWQNDKEECMCVSLLEDGDTALVRHGGLSMGDAGIPIGLWSPHRALSHRWYQDTRSSKEGKKTGGRERWGLSRVSKREGERKMGEEEGSWPWTYAASPCQAPLAQATHAYAALLLLLPLQPSPTPTPWHYLVKQSWRDESGKRRGLPSLSTARVGLLSLDNTAWLYTHTYIYRVVAFSCLASHPLNFVTLPMSATIQERVL